MSRFQDVFDYVMVTEWRDILRPIRDRLDNIRDRLPGAGAEDPATTRRKTIQRCQDILRGFAYFDSFEDLETWTPGQVDPLQRSTFPLIARHESLLYRRRTENKHARIMICHDYSGGYHPYESSSRNSVERKDFFLQHLSYIEVFIYFSHHLVSVPPPAWTNTLHRHGILSLGTFMIEHRLSGRDRILDFEETEDGRIYPVAKTLANMAIEYGFDGWLINIESTLQPWKLATMTCFLLQLRTLMGPERRVVWYDALTRDGKIQHQNALNSSNGQFFEACDDILINYKWNKESLDLSLDFASNNALDAQRVYFGVDVWAQNKPQDLLRPRTTYPSSIGGGTNSGLAVVECARRGFSTCIFGPAWTQEHFKKDSDIVSATSTMWKGRPLPSAVDCHCYPHQPAMRGDHTPASSDISILAHAASYPSGTESFFWSDFVTAFSPSTDSLSMASKAGVSSHWVAHLGSQSVLPLCVDEFLSDNLWCKLGETLPGMLTVGVPAHNDKSIRSRWEIGLFATQIRLPVESKQQELLVDITFECMANLWTPILVLTFSDGTATSYALLGSQKRTESFAVQAKEQWDGHDTFITNISIVVLNHEINYAHYPSENRKTELLRLYNLSVMLQDLRAPDEFEVVPIRGSDYPAAINIRPLHRDSAEKGVPSHVRIAWDLNELAMRAPDDGLHHPTSHITGAMSHFEVYINDEHVDRVYGLEMVLPERFMDAWSNNENLQVQVDCVRFGGIEYEGTIVNLSMADAEWEIL